MANIDKGTIALARTSDVQAGSVTTISNRINSLSRSLGIIYDSSSDVSSNATIDRVTALETSNSNLDSRVTTLETAVAAIQTKMEAVATLFGITFNSDGTINTENYTTHTHNYIDSTIEDTDDGTGEQADTIKTTNGVN